MSSRPPLASPPLADDAPSSPPPPPDVNSPPPSSPSPPPPGSPALLPDDDDDDQGPASPDLPLTMTASTNLLHLPRDATAALEAAAARLFFRDTDKVVVRFKGVAAAPPLPGAAHGADVRRKISATQKFDAVVAFVRRALRVRESDAVFLYVNSAFAPALDEVVGNLHQVRSAKEEEGNFSCGFLSNANKCFKDSHDQLNVSYSLTPAFG